MRTALLVVSLLSTLALSSCEPAKRQGLPDPGPGGVSLTVQTEPPGGTVVIDGVPVGKAPQTVKLRPGAHHFKSTLSGYFPADQRVSVSASGPKAVTLTLVASH